MKSLFERYLTVWVALCIVGGILLGKVAPEVAQAPGRHVPVRERRTGGLDPDRDLSVLHDVPDHGEDRLRLGG